MCRGGMHRRNHAYYFATFKLIFVIILLSLIRNIHKLNNAVDDYVAIDKPTFQQEKIVYESHLGLRAIITGLEHSGTKLVGRVLANAPCIMGAYETGYLLAPTPKDIEDVVPWFEWNSAKANMTIENYRLQPDDVEAMKNAKDFIQMYDILRNRSYLFNELNDDEQCMKPSYMIDKTPRYVYPQYFQNILEKTPGVPVVVTQVDYEKLCALWRRHGGSTLPRELYDHIVNNVWKMKKKYPLRILIVSDIEKYPEQTMMDIFHHVGLEWKDEYLNMTGLLKKFSNDQMVINEILKWISDDEIDHEVDHSRCPEVDDNGKRKLQLYAEEVQYRKKTILGCKEDDSYNTSSKCFGLAKSFVNSTMLLTRKEREIKGDIDLNKQLQYLEDAERCAMNFVAAASDEPSFTQLIKKLYIEMGILERRRGELSRAQKYFTKALEIEATNREAIWHLQQLHSSTKDKSLSTKLAIIQKQVIKQEENAAYNSHGTGQAVLCVIAMDENPYIDEFVDFHLGIGFGKIIIYDNTNAFQLKQWRERREGNRITVIHYPGLNKQGDAYLDCAKNSLNGQHGSNILWAAFWDVDEFLVLKKHDNVDDFLKEHLMSGALGINWLFFGPSGRTVRENLPVLKRFVYRENGVNMHVKSIVRLSDMNLTEAPHVHYPTLPMLNGNQHDTNGNIFRGAFNPSGPTNVAVLNHYMTKSFEEYKDKRVRGRADLPDWSPGNPGFEYKLVVKQATADYEEALANNGNICRTIENRVSGQIPGKFDDSAWMLLTRLVPKYALYDALDTIAY